jgi:hypothetical protein
MRESLSINFRSILPQTPCKTIHQQAGVFCIVPPAPAKDAPAEDLVDVPWLIGREKISWGFRLMAMGECL